MNEPISALMQRQVRTVSMDDTVAEVESLFTRHGLTWAPVLEAGSGSTVVGVISASDFLRFHAQERGDATVMPVWQLCSYKPVGVDEATPVGEVARLMVDQVIHHVVVTNREGIVGIVSSLDFVRTFIDR